MGNFCIKTADRRALVKELGRVYYELAVEKVRLRMAEDIAVDYSTDSDEAWRMHSDLAETTSKFFMRHIGYSYGRIFYWWISGILWLLDATGC